MRLMAECDASDDVGAKADDVERQTQVLGRPLHS